MKYVDNFWVGGTELVIMFDKGNHCVLEDNGCKWELVFKGHYDACVDYCRTRENEYQDIF